MEDSQKNQWVCRWAPSLGRLEESSDIIWGTSLYDEKTDQEKSCVFFGLYGLPDFYSLWRHKGRKVIFFAGTDITHFQNGYWLDKVGNIRMDNTSLATWINENCESWCENEVERAALELVGIQARVNPSFLGNVNNFQLSYTQAQRPQVYSSVSGNNFSMYGWDIIERIAGDCEVDFHLYGNTIPWASQHSNVFVHGKVSKETMNEETRNMQGALRLCMPDGFSEILAKSILWAQWPIAWEAFKYPHIQGANGISELVRLINALKFKSKPNLEGREYYLKTFNNFPWNVHK